MRFGVATVTAFIAFAVMSVVALMHEDEVGQRDWYVANVGRVERAAFVTSPYVKNVVVATEEGVVAALATVDKGTIRWRHHLLHGAESIACLAVTQNTVAVVSSSGAGHLVHPASGVLVATFSIELPAGAAVKACAFPSEPNARSLRVASVKGSDILITDVPTDDAEALIEPIRATHKQSVANSIAALEFASGAALLWIQRQEPSGIDVLDIAGKVLFTSDIKGTLVPSDASAANVLVEFVSEKSEHGKTLKVLELGGAASGRTIKASATSQGTSCKNCRAYFLQNGDVATTAVVIREPSSEDGFDVYVGGIKARVPYLGTYPPRILAARSANSARPRFDLLLRATNSHVLLVSVADDGSAAIQWERFEGIAAPAYTKVVPLPAVSLKTDTFGFDVQALILSRFGTLYRLPVAKSGEEIVVVADVAVALFRALGKSTGVCGAVYKGFSVDDNGVARVVAVLQGQPVWIDVEVASGAIVATNVKSQGSLTNGPVYISSDLSVLGDLTVAHRDGATVLSAPQFLYSVNVSEGSFQGLTVQPSATTAVKTWSVRLGTPVVAYNAPSEDPLIVSTVQNLRVFPNTTTKEKTNEIRRKYPTHNILAAATLNAELSRLTVTILDTITGSILSTSHISSATGPVHILVVEHAVIVHFLNVERLRYAVAVLELFEQEDNSIPLEATGASPPQVIASFFVGKKSFSSRASRPPTVVVQVLAFPGGALDAMTATTSYQSINRKQVIFALADGRVHAVDLRQLLFGGQFNPQKPEETFEHVILPSVNVISHIHHVLKAQRIAVTPTELESSAHVLVAGVDVMYSRVSLGKAFDMLNEDFNHELLIIVTILMGVLTVIARHFASRKMLKMAWA